MPIQFTRSWTDPEIALFQDTVVRFIEEKMVPGDEAARHHGAVV
jgi:acyl-CoA dehydrogenase